MACDAWLLDQLVAGQGTPVLRFYRWSRPTLSLGFHQRRLAPHWPALVREGLLDVVRRPSGGRAVLHAGELTYALVQPALSGRRVDTYTQACQWLQQAFAGLGQPLQFGQVGSAEAQQRTSCFATSTAADLIHGNGAKRIGSAQLWRQGCVLQHGSVLLNPPAELWQRVFEEAPPALPPLGLGWPQLAEALQRAAEQHLCAGALQEQPLTAAEWEGVERLSLSYRATAAGLLTA
jgi:lipoate-protein ligase A